MILAMVFIVIFSAISIGFLSLSSANTQIADNHRVGNNAINAALSGLEMVRYWSCNSEISFSGLSSPSERYTGYIDNLQSELDDAGIYNTYDADTETLSIGSGESPIALDSAADSCFYAIVTSAGTAGINVQITGQAKQITRTIGIQFTYGVRPNSVFDFGVATKGPLELNGSASLTGATVRSESDVYIDYFGADCPLILAPATEIAGNAKIVNPAAAIGATDIKGEVGGYSGQDALDNSVDVGATPTEFPYPDATHFKQYATGGNYTNGTSLTNKIIPAGMGTTSSPLKITKNTTINGILFIESPNVVEFGGNVTVNGMIIAEGDYADNSAVNKLSFTGSVDSRTLPTNSEFDALRAEKGTFLLAPGFDLTFWGSFGTINGAIMGNGITFGGNAGGTVNGSVINYSTKTMTVSGSTDITFNRSGITEIPAGFIQEIIIHYNPESYQENI